MTKHTDWEEKKIEETAKLILFRNKVHKRYEFYALRLKGIKEILTQMTEELRSTQKNQIIKHLEEMKKDLGLRKDESATSRCRECGQIREAEIQGFNQVLSETIKYLKTNKI